MEKLREALKDLNEINLKIQELERERKLINEFISAEVMKNSKLSGCVTINKNKLWKIIN